MRLVARAIALCLWSAVLPAQVRVAITDPGRGASARLLQQSLARPHRVVAPDTGWLVLGRGEREPADLIVLGRTAAVSGSVEGNIVVVGGDLFIRPGGHVAGEAIAIGGGVYVSALALVEQGTRSFRDNTFDIAPTARGFELSYRSLRAREPAFTLPGVYGLRVPSYDRVNGASLPLGPSFFLGGEPYDIAIEVLATYRSDLGAVDPAVSADLGLSPHFRLRGEVERATFTNEDWIWSDFVNSLSALFLGTDTRNFFRADRAQATLHRDWESLDGSFEPFVGFRGERAWAVGPSLGTRAGPWSLWGRTDTLGIWRPNPAVPANRLWSLLAGAGATWTPAGIDLRGTSTLERSLARSDGSGTDATFTQLTSNVRVAFPTFAGQEYRIEVHWVATSGEAPAQRFGYLGGSGTMPFLDLLTQGGDEVLLVDQRYAIPLSGIHLGFFGSPDFELRHRLGGAGLGRLPALEQVIGLGLSLTLVRGEVQVDPADGRARAGIGLTFTR